MDRRAFLAALAAGAIVTAEGLWVPGQKLISIPSGNRLSTIDWITREMLLHAKRNFIALNTLRLQSGNRFLTG